MYRVELKRDFLHICLVPNDRVELKVMRYAWKYIYSCILYQFLMYRVELKASQDQK
jgi:hypothetical protein